MTTYFDLHTSGIGYVNRVREVCPRKGQAFMACDIVALSGDSAEPVKTRFDCKVSGAEADRLIRLCQGEIAENKRVLIGFRIGDLNPEIFTYDKGPKAGEQGISLKARLLFVSWVKVDGELVYRAPSKDDTPAIDSVHQEVLAA